MSKAALRLGLALTWPAWAPFLLAICAVGLILALPAVLFAPITINGLTYRGWR